MTVTVTHVESDGSSVALGWGTTEDGREVTFAGEPRLMYPLALAIASGETPEVEIETWQVLG